MRNGVSDLHSSRRQVSKRHATGERDDAAYFDALYSAREDPWGLRTTWYERRKLRLVLSMLAKERYASVFEPGCGIGELTAALATRCEALLAWDISAEGLAIARRRVTAPSVRFERNAVPAQWPQGSFDLIVISELAYYLSRLQQRTLAQLAARSLSPSGTLLACHWRHPIDDAKTTAIEAHRTIADASGLVSLARYDDEDVIIDVWSDHAFSIARTQLDPT